MQRGETGRTGPLRTGADQVNAAALGQLIGDALQIAERTVNSRPHFAPPALRLTLQRQPTRCAFDGPGRQRLRDGVLPSRQALPAAACDIDRQGAEPHSPGTSGIPEE
jgi:hypothetical protein